MAPSPVVVFGAFDRHNLGDLLFAHLAQALLPGEELIVAGLASRD
ncbi:MAG: polysaccharide pyruvyl transferase family protein, partial [Rubrivivax sp.]|nr:polysaccharide pyruvyl transferase family protein [Rubrivivax sp.]